MFGALLIKCPLPVSTVQPPQYDGAKMHVFFLAPLPGQSLKGSHRILSAPSCHTLSHSRHHRVSFYSILLCTPYFSLILSTPVYRTISTPTRSVPRPNSMRTRPAHYTTPHHPSGTCCAALGRNTRRHGGSNVLSCFCAFFHQCAARSAEVMCM